jgi:hypothetical protein
LVLGYTVAGDSSDYFRSQLGMQFENPSSGTFTNELETNGITGLFTLSATSNTAPSVLAGKKLTDTTEDGQQAVIVLNKDTSFTLTSTNKSFDESTNGILTGTWKYYPGGPNAVGLQLNVTPQVLGTNTLPLPPVICVTLDFASHTNGTSAVFDCDEQINLYNYNLVLVATNSQSGKFTIH